VHSATADAVSPLLKSSFYCFTVGITSVLSDAKAGETAMAAANANIVVRI
jgi:hypothetical protein